MELGADVERDIAVEQIEGKVELEIVGGWATWMFGLGKGQRQ